MFLLAVTIVLSVLSASIPLLIKSILACICVVTSQEKSLQNDEMKIRNEMANISMVDEFAKHARLQRKLIRVQEDLRTAANSRMSSYRKTRLFLSYSAQLVITLTFMAFVWMNYYTLVAVLPSKWLWPFGFILSWPTGVEGGISIMWWILLLGTGVRTIMAQVVA
ncbi:guided entry of tail-anchored proteins factor 1 [Anabrus simplex]|uniref:guided entry of tail-anchored proteins factor 1 n=1 Tax=Anabrus simplex TaxID=316456 RepID=UPI0035A3C33E